MIQTALARIAPHIHRTPVLHSRLLDEMVGASVFFKCENFQRGGSYKLRGALNASLQLDEARRARGLTTHSSGNFAQAIALAARQLGVPAYIVMPETAPQPKIDATRGYGAEVIICGPTLAHREAMSKEVIARTGATFLHSSNMDDVIAGQGTAAWELLEGQPALDAIFCPVGGGGLIAGTCLAAAGRCAVLGGEPFEADDAYRSLQSGRIESNETTDTIADGLRTQLGDRNFPIIREHVQKIVRVTEEEIVAAMKLIWTRLKIVVEPSSAVTFAALLRDREAWRGQRVGVIVSGGNVDLANLPF